MAPHTVMTTPHAVKLEILGDAAPILMVIAVDHIAALVGLAAIAERVLNALLFKKTIESVLSEYVYYYCCEPWYINLECNC